MKSPTEYLYDELDLRGTIIRDADLSILEQRIQDKIAETKIKMDKTMQRAETDHLWPIIETLK